MTHIRGFHNERVTPSRCCLLVTVVFKSRCVSVFAAVWCRKTDASNLVTFSSKSTTHADDAVDRAEAGVRSISCILIPQSLSAVYRSAGL